MESGRVMWWTVMMMMGNMVVQETPEVTKRSGGLLGGFDCRRRGMLLGWGTVRRWSRNGSVWRNSRV